MAYLLNQGIQSAFKIWKNLIIFLAFLSIILCAVNCYLSQQSGHHEPPEYQKYGHMRGRTKIFPWGEDNKSLFHNPHVKALPDGYEHY
ncbi:unnamed protein product [Diabrotica balteata]|uniref:Cytochrome c oxidase subunit n=1 Tax=Diabrotica balteata TaxID=107213 RepID=A0A9N9T266_DIABA|nr:unnamed protein product [Diabrotica balteata]